MDGLEERTTEARGKWKAKESKGSWGRPGRGERELDPEIREIKLGMITELSVLVS